MQSKLIEHPHAAVIDDVVDVEWTIVKRWDGREDHRAHFCARSHVAKVCQIKRRFSRHQHQFAPFLEHDVRRAGDQIVGQAIGDCSQCPHGAWRDHHAFAQERTARDARPYIAAAVDDVGSVLELLPPIDKFFADVEHGGLRHNQMGLPATLVFQHCQQTQPVDRTGCSGYGNDDPFHERAAPTKVGSETSTNGQDTLVINLSPFLFVRDDRGRQVEPPPDPKFQNS